MTTTIDNARAALVKRLFDATIATLELHGVYLGERLGLYRALAEAQGLTVAGRHRRHIGARVMGERTEDRSPQVPTDARRRPTASQTGLACRRQPATWSRSSPRPTGAASGHARGGLGHGLGRPPWRRLSHILPARDVVL